MIFIKLCKKILTIAFLFLLTFSYFSCAPMSEDEYINLYFESLDLVKEGRLNKAIDSLDKIYKNENKAIGVFALEEMIPLLYEQDDFDTVLALSKKELSHKNENTENYLIDSDFLYRYMLLSLIQTEPEVASAEVEKWVADFPFSKQHNIFFEESEFMVSIHDSEDFAKKIAIKQAVFDKDYNGACKIIESMVDGNDEGEYFTNRDEYFLSDIGKALLYGAENTLNYAEMLELVAKTYPENSSEAFMCYFYAGRLYEKTKAYIPVASIMYEKAVKASTKESHFDNALWYYLSALRKMSARNCIEGLLEYAIQWHDPYYFDDLLNTLAYQLLDIKNYKGFYALFNAISEYMSPESVSKYAYMSALFIEQGYLNSEFETPSDKEIMSVNLYEKSVNVKNGSLYYKIMAAYELDFSTQDALRTFSSFASPVNVTPDKNLEKILLSYLDRAFFEKTYTLFMENYELISMSCAIEIANRLIDTNTYNTEALRIISKSIHSMQEEIPADTMKLLYPDHYSAIVEQVAVTYDLEETILYALIRSESYFDSDIESWAGAIGLTQLMPLTAKDIARKLRVSEYDLHDPRKNIDFGAFYLDELLPRFGVDNSVLRALFAYNAGITNVRRWGNAYPNLLDTMPLFLESIPFAETREYGRKLLTANVMYALLYTDIEFKDAVEYIMK